MPHSKLLGIGQTGACAPAPLREKLASARWRALLSSLRRGRLMKGGAATLHADVAHSEPRRPPLKLMKL